MKKLLPILLLAPLLFTNCSLFDRASGLPSLHNVDWRKKNIIIVLGMRSERVGQEVLLPKFALPRVTEAERLYRECKLKAKDCRILASGGDPAENGVSEAELIKRELIKKQIPAKDILLEDKSVSTLHNAKYSSEILARESPDVTVLVTSDIHIVRALKMFKLFNVFPLPAPADDPTAEKN